MNILEAIADLFDFAVSNSLNEYKRLDIGAVSESLAQQVFLQTGVDISNHIFTLDNYAILHTLDQHGNSTNEEKRGQTAVRRIDFGYLYQIIQTPDKVSSVGKSLLGNDVLKFEKQIDNLYTTVWEVRKVRKKRKKNRLALITLYIRKTKAS